MRWQCEYCGEEIWHLDTTLDAIENSAMLEDASRHHFERCPEMRGE